LKKGLESEFTTVDIWDILDNPHGLDNQQDVKNNTKLYKLSSKSTITAEFGLCNKSSNSNSGKLIIAIVDLLQYVYVRDFGEQTVIRRIPICSFPHKFVCIGDDQIIVHLNENVFYKLNWEMQEYKQIGSSEHCVTKMI